MKKPVLVILAAGMGSRYGGLKQIDPVDEQGHVIIDFSIYDAIRAGFEKIVFIIKKENETDFKETIGARVSKFAQVEYVYQELERLPEGFTVPEGRQKPWGTGHAILCCEDVIDGPFAVINSDDYYGPNGFKMLYDFLTTEVDGDRYNYAMIGYIIENTLTDHGSVSRGVCETDGNNHLTVINERTNVIKKDDHAAYSEDKVTWVDIPKGTTVSMNMWGFTESIMDVLKDGFAKFMREEVPDNLMKSEYFIPKVVGKLVTEGKADVTILTSEDKWFGVTYKEDKEHVVNAVKKLKEDGVYPTELWK